MSDSYKFQGRGKVYLHERSALGVPGAGLFVGCTDELPLNFAVETFEHIERCSGNDAIDFTGTKKKTGDGSLKLTEISADNLALALNGKIVAAGTTESVVDEVLPTGIVAGSSVILGGANPHSAITSLVIEDSTSAALTVDTDYTLNPETGNVVFVTTPANQPCTASYSHTDGEYVSIFSAPQAERWLRFDFKNKADQFKRGVVDLYHVKFEPTTGLPLISDELMVLELKFSLLIDSEKSDTGDLGQFGRFTTPATPT